MLESRFSKNKLMANFSFFILNWLCLYATLVLASLYLLDSESSGGFCSLVPSLRYFYCCFWDIPCQSFISQFSFLVIVFQSFSWPEWFRISLWYTIIWVTFSNTDKLTFNWIYLWVVSFLSSQVQSHYPCIHCLNNNLSFIFLVFK